MHLVDVTPNCFAPILNLTYVGIRRNREQMPLTSKRKPPKQAIKQAPTPRISMRCCAPRDVEKSARHRDWIFHSRFRMRILFFEKRSLLYILAPEHFIGGHALRQ
jgi:hypothetical protein